MSRPGTTTLFAPPTPPASPTPGATLKPDAHPKSWSLSTPRSLLTSAVPADEDPLSPAAPASTSESELRHNPGNEQHYTTLPEPRPYVSPSSSSNTLRTNSTLAFFDKFVHQAKAASENKRRSLLDELLLHQDDPLFRRVRRENEEDEEEAGNTDLGNEISADKDGDVDEDGNSVDMAEGKNSSTSRVRRVHGSSEDDEGIADSDSETRGQVQDALGTLLVGPSDRDPALCSNSPQSSPQPPPSSFRAPGQSPPRSRHHRTRRPSTSTSSTSVSSSSSARHSPTLSLPSLAPPLLTEGLDLMDDVLSVEREGDVARGERREHGPEGDTLPRSNSPYSTLSRLPTRWISSLSSSLSRSGSTPPSSNQAKNKDRRRPTGATPSLESIFAASSSTPAPTSRGRPGTSKKRTATSLTPSTSFLDILDWDGGSGSGVATPVPGAHDQSHRDGGDNNNIDIIPHRHPGGRSTAHNNGASAQPAGKGHVYVQTPIQIPAPHNRSEWPSTSHGHSPAPASITHETPFGSHVFAPISGAPGFMDKRYDWDKGYSNGLMREMREDDGSVEQEVKGWESDVGRNVSANGNGSVKLKGRRESVVKRIKGKIEEKMGTKKVADKENEGASVTVVVSEGRLGLGEFMEKKSGSIELTSRKDATIPVLDVGLADTLRPQLAALDRLPRTWHLVYSLDQHGISLNTLYNRCEAHAEAQAKLGVTRGAGGLGIGRPGMLLVIKDSGDAVFGVWMGEGIKQSKGKGYYGSGDSFMWRYVSGQLSTFRWTGKNKYVALCEPDYISFGGGDGRYGLYLDESLFDGSSAWCVTFDNDPLCSPGPDKAGAVAFECVGLEVWAVGP